MAILLLFVAIDIEQVVKDYEISHQLFLQKDYHQAEKYFSHMVRNYGRTEFGYELRYRLAECHFNLGDYYRARDDFVKLLSDRNLPLYLKPEVLYALGITSIILKDFKTAQAILNQLVKNPAYQNEDRANFAIGVFHYFNEAYEEALTKLKENQLLEARFYLGKTYSRLNRPLDAIQTFKEVTDRAPNTPIATLAHFASGQALFENRDYSGALIKFEYFITRHPGSPLVDYGHYFLAASLVHLRRYPEALEHLVPLTKHSDNLLAAHAGYFVGICKLGLDLPRDAVSYFQRVRANFPNTAIASYANLQLVMSQLNAGDVQSALLSATQLATMFRTGDLASVGDYLSGYLMYRAGHLPEAANHFAIVLKTYPKSPLREPAAAMFLLVENELRSYETSITFGSKYLKDYPNETSPWRSQILYLLGEANYFQARYEDAENYYRYASSGEIFQRTTPYARLGLGYCLYHQKRYPDAIDVLKPLITILPEDSSFTIAALLGLGYAYFNQGEYLKALNSFETSYNTYPLDSRAIEKGLFYSGLSYYNLEYYGQAVESWEKLINTMPRAELAAEAGFRTGDTYFKALKYDRAVALFRWVVEFHPGAEYARSSQLAIAQAYYNQKNYDEAIREYQKFLDLYATDPLAESARKGLEMCYYRKGLTDTTTMKEFVEKFPQSELAGDGQFSLARELFDNKEYDKAAFEFEKVVINFPKSSMAAEAQLLAAESYVNLKEWEKAKASYERFIRYFPEHKQSAAAHFNLATVYYNTNDYESALKHFKIVADSYSGSEYAQDAAYNVSVCLRKLGQETQALKALDAYSVKGGKQDVLILEKARILFDRSDYHGLLSTLKDYLPGDDKKKAEVIFYLGEANRNLGSKTKAIAYYQELGKLKLVDNPFVLKGLTQWAIILEEEKKNREAVRIYQKIIAATTSVEVKKAAENRIGYLKGG
ncbi:MAG TPA: tetratricopeptide repeat protein [bacterium (Candidatus Stahlbacteria)]|nr:tetratricopeptide repeat protein [Candidatus Stahlbacteria bacterium]